MESAVSFAPLRPADFVNFVGRGGARPAFCGAGRGSLFFRGAGRPSLNQTHEHRVCSSSWDVALIRAIILVLRNFIAMLPRYCTTHDLELYYFRKKPGPTPIREELATINVYLSICMSDMSDKGFSKI